MIVRPGEISCDCCQAELPAASSPAALDRIWRKARRAGWVTHARFHKHYCPRCCNFPVDQWGDLIKTELVGPPWPPPFVGPPWPPPAPRGDVLAALDHYLKYAGERLAKSCQQRDSRLLQMLK